MTDKRVQLISCLLISFVALNLVEQAQCSGTLSTLISLARSSSSDGRSDSAASAAASTLVAAPQADLPASQWATPVRLPGAKKNKVSKLLHLMHDKTTDYIYAPKIAEVSAGATASANSEGGHSTISASAAVQTTGDGQQQQRQRDWFHMSDDEVISAACDNLPTKIICNQMVKVVLKRSREDKAKIAAAIRSKPLHVQASKVLYNALLGITVQSVESKGYDEKLDKLINLAATRTPYGFAAVKTLDMVM